MASSQRVWTTPTVCCTGRQPSTSIGCRSRRTHWLVLSARHRVLPAPLNFDAGFITGCLCVTESGTRQQSSLTAASYRTRTTQTPTYLASLIHSYTPSRTLRSSDQLLLTVSIVTLALSAKAFSVNAPAVWNSLSLNCRSPSSLNIFKRRLKSELFTSAYGPTQPVYRHRRRAPPIRLRLMALYKFALYCTVWNAGKMMLRMEINGRVEMEGRECDLLLLM